MTTLNAVETNLDIINLRQDFPVLQTQVHDQPLAYLDNAASAQKPQCVIDAIEQVYSQHYSNVHRGIHTLSERSTAMYEKSREIIRDFINARDLQEIIFVRGTTEAINLVAQSYGRNQIQAGDEILITEMEHHSNIVPWQLLCQQTGAILKYIPINEDGELCQNAFEQLITPRVKLFALSHISNALGTVNPIQQLIDMAHTHNIPVLIDGAQAIPHCQVDVQALDCDFYAFSGHKAFGPCGIGVLYGKAELLEAMPPYQGGGEMIAQVSLHTGTKYHVLPHKFEAGTPNIVGAIGLGRALEYLAQIDMKKIHAYEQALLTYGTQALEKIPGLRLVGTAKKKTSILSFVLDNIHAHDIGTILDFAGIAIRSGHHCAMPIMEHFNLAATSRASLAFYNTTAEIDRLIAGLYHVKEVFK